MQKGRCSMDEKQRIIKLENEVGDLKTRLAVAEASIKGIEEDVGSIKDNTTWILRLTVGGLVGAALTFFMNGGFNI